MVLFFLAGCSTRQIAVRMALPLVQGQYASIQEEMDPLLAERAIPANLKMMEGLLKEDEDNRALLMALSEGFCGYAFSFLEETSPRRAAAMYTRGKDYALRALAAETGIDSLDRLPRDKYAAALSNMENGNVPALFWLGQCWSGWVMLSLDNPTAFADISKVEGLMLRVLELDPMYHYAGPHLFLGIFYGARSRMLGGDPEKARRHFEENLKLTANRFLLTRYFYAKTYAVQVQDRKIFEKQLDTVLKTPSDVLPGQRLANEVAKMKARRLLEAADDLF
ncbi:MAG: TRAP transporter TatT component family protein [Nitrospinaceae bacterium]